MPSQKSRDQLRDTLLQYFEVYSRSGGKGKRDGRKKEKEKKLKSFPGFTHL
jgi:hypothetical protein